MERKTVTPYHFSIRPGTHKMHVVGIAIGASMVMVGIGMSVSFHDVGPEHVVPDAIGTEVHVGIACPQPVPHLIGPLTLVLNKLWPASNGGTEMKNGQHRSDAGRYVAWYHASMGLM